MLICSRSIFTYIHTVHTYIHTYTFLSGAQYIHLSPRAVDEDHTGHIRLHIATHAQVQQHFNQRLSYAGDSSLHLEVFTLHTGVCMYTYVCIYAHMYYIFMYMYVCMYSMLYVDEYIVIFPCVNIHTYIVICYSRIIFT